ncbi:hypothetical protein PRIPAC_82373 [Pristionchus pacificus]|uniref:Uncharacterized protein n=1 Tax=Pristionchus pacificus TaxID=54126 RepID=A0A2A6BHB4_PRIPA|nr:hypothetical protein PRIPAC_82373 [Pristionchus pacificus]|eukprot:PDM65201.1 hypothetical protein PRIPAC_52143 [Pristionchus pacificus]
MGENSDQTNADKQGRKRPHPTKVIAVVTLSDDSDDEGLATKALTVPVITVSCSSMNIDWFEFDQISDSEDDEPVANALKTGLPAAAKKDDGRKNLIPSMPTRCLDLTCKTFPIPDSPPCMVQHLERVHRKSLRTMGLVAICDKCGRRRGNYRHIFVHYAECKASFSFVKK